MPFPAERRKVMTVSRPLPTAGLVDTRGSGFRRARRLRSHGGSGGGAYSARPFLHETIRFHGIQLAGGFVFLFSGAEFLSNMIAEPLEG